MPSNGVKGAARLEVKADTLATKYLRPNGKATFDVLIVPTAKNAGKIDFLTTFTTTFARYEKMGIVGSNGTGKSTFIKLLLGLEQLDEGRFVVGETVRCGYFSQDGMDFNEQDKVIDAVRKHAEYIDLGNGRHLTAMQFLTHFLFPPARQQDYIYKLSGAKTYLL